MINLRGMNWTPPLGELLNIHVKGPSVVGPEALVVVVADPFML